MTLKVEGTIPIDLEGTYFRNGPGLQVNMAGCNRHTFGEMDMYRCLLSDDVFTINDIDFSFLSPTMSLLLT